MPTNPKPERLPPQAYRCACGFVGTFDQVIDHVAKLHRLEPTAGHAVMLREHYARAKS